MSEQDREKKFESDEDSDDVEAHRKWDKGAADEGTDEGDDDVEAHVRLHKDG
jgi:hypothetical protein